MVDDFLEDLLAHGQSRLAAARENAEKAGNLLDTFPVEVGSIIKLGHIKIGVVA